MSVRWVGGEMIRTPRCDSLGALYIRSCEWKGDRPLFVDEHLRLSGRDALDRSLRLASGFATLGAGRGEVVAFLCKPSARHAAAWFAVPLSGRVACNLHVRETPQRLGEALAWLGARVLVHDGDLEQLAQASQQVAAGAGHRLERVCLGGAAPGVASAGHADGASPDAAAAGLAVVPTDDSLLAHAGPFDWNAAPTRPEELAAILLSSGSTGRPKGVMHSQATLLETAKGGQYAFGHVGQDDATLLLMQPSFAAWVIITLPFVGGRGKIVYRQQFTPAGFLQTLEQERITLAPLVPTMWRMVFAEDTGRYDLSALRISTISGEPPAPSDIEQLRARIAPGVISLYLSSEAATASGVIAFTSDLLRPGKTAASGRPGVGVDVRIIDPAGGFDDEVVPGEPGEIAISGPSVALGYWKDEALTRERFRDGWWRSGDLGRIDADGDVWVLGRIDNVINTGGIKVSGEEIEQALLGHPAVVQCAVVGLPDERFGQRIEAFVVCPGVKPGGAELDGWCRDAGGLAGYKVPKAFHVVDVLPTGPTGKLYRRALREA